MPLAVTHVLLTIIVVDLFRDYVLKKKYKKYFTLHTILIAGIAGLLPDIDVPINMILNFFGYFPDLVLHGGLTHTPIFGLIFLRNLKMLDVNNAMEAGGLLPNKS